MAFADATDALPAAPIGNRRSGVRRRPGNRLILALVLEERVPERLEEARRLLESVASATPRPDYVAEDLAIREQARERLAALAQASG